MKVSSVILPLLLCTLASALAVEGHAFSKRISFGCVALDEICRNGIATRGITEICGVSSSGKSQICMQLALVVQLAEERGGLGKGVVYLCTEDAFPSKRLHQMAQSCSKRFGSIGRPVDFLDSIFLEHISDSVRYIDSNNKSFAKRTYPFFHSHISNYVKV